MNVAEVIVGYLERLGVRHVFGYPGDPNVEFLECARRAGLEFVLARREGTAAFMAEAYGMVTGRPGVCISTLGPGSSNLVNGVANAFLDRVPMLAVSGQIETRRQPFFTHQVLDHGRLFAPITKWATAVMPNTAGTIMRKAVRVAMAERPGPVHLTVAADVIGAAALDADVTLPPLAPAGAGTLVLMAEAGLDPLRPISEARRPVILAGIAAARSGASPALVRLAEALTAPVVVAPMAKGVFPETHALFAGTLDMACNAFVWDFLKRSDLLLCAGFDAVELIKPWSLAVPAIHIDATPNTDQIYQAEIELVGAIPQILAWLAAEATPGSAWTEREIAEHKRQLFRLMRAGRAEGRLNPTDVVDTVRAAFPEETVATVDVGSHKLLVGQGWTTASPRGLLMTNGLSSMGFALPAAIAAKLQMPERPVVCFVGDGGLAMVQGELRVAASLGLEIAVVVFCDDSLNRIELKQRARQFPSFGTLLDPTDVPKLAESMGCAGAAAASVAELERALASPGGRGVPLVIGARIDPAQYQAQF
jgi:acetolactate synthase-1/2/3 large subunit